MKSIYYSDRGNPRCIDPDSAGFDTTHENKHVFVHICSISPPRSTRDFGLI